MSAISSVSVNPRTNELDFKSRLAPALKPDVNRVPANPFFPMGRIPQEATESVQKFESNLPGQTPVESRKIGTVLNTLA